jgi:hypothetical protein
MKKRWIVPGLLVAVFTFAATGTANPGHGKEPGHGHHHGHWKHGKHWRHHRHGKFHTFGPYDVATDDHGSCGNAWAADTEKRTFTVHKRKDGSYALLRFDRGTFLTAAGQSPGACDTKGRHGATVAAGVKGRFGGYLVGNITGGVFNPNATCTADCGLTDVWISTHFGPSATFSCFESSKACRFGFGYSALKHQGLRYRHWFDMGRGAGTFLQERFFGDIANA